MERGVRRASNVGDVVVLDHQHLRVCGQHVLDVLRSQRVYHGSGRVLPARRGDDGARPRPQRRGQLVGYDAGLVDRDRLGAPAALRGRYMATMSLSWWIGLAVAPTVGTRLLAASPAAALLPAAGLVLAAGVAALALGRHLPAAISRTPRPAAAAAAGGA